MSVPDQMTKDTYDLCVIGAGTSGIASARFYLDVHPDAKVVLLERDHSVGGVWSSGECQAKYLSRSIGLMSCRTCISRLSFSEWNTFWRVL